MKKNQLVVGVAALALTATACGAGAANDDPGARKAGGTFSFYSGEPEHLIPTNTNESEGGQILDAVYAGLVTYDPKTTKLRNLIADSVESSDNQHWTIKLKDGWTFHNGEPVTAESFVNAWNYGAYAPNAQGNSYFFDRIKGYEDTQSEDPDGEEGPKTAPEPKAKKLAGLKAVDDNTIEVELTSPFSQFPLLLGYTAFYPMADACLADIKACEEQPIGNGPLKFDGKWQHNQGITLVRFDEYQGEKALADKIEVKIYEKIETGYNDFLAGELDVLDSTPPEKYAEAKSQFADRLIEKPTSKFTYIGLPTYVKQFKNSKVRQALSLAIDRKAITQKVLNGTETPAGSVVSPVVLGSRDDACEYCHYDPARAKQLLAEAGGFQGKIVLWFNAGAGHETWMQAVGDQLKKNLNIEYTLKGDLQFPEYLEVADQKKFTGGFRLGWIMDYPSPENYLKPIHGTQGSSNVTKYSNKAVDKLIAEGDAAQTIEDGVTKYQAAEDLILQDMQIIPLWFGNSTTLFSENVSEVTVTPFSRIDLARISVLAP